MPIALEELHFSLIHIGLEHFCYVVEIACGTIDDIFHISFFDFLFKEMFSVEHRHLFSAGLVAGNNRDVVEFLNSRPLCLIVEVEVALIVNVVGCKAS